MKTIKKIPRPPLRDQIYESLKTAIVTLELKPGQRILDKDLAASFGVSRTPVREALKRLEDEGLVESLPGSKTRVTEIDLKEAKNAFTVVAALHGLAARLAFPFITEDKIVILEKSNQRLENALEKRDVMAAVQADDEFHRVILNASGNREIDLALDRLMSKIRRLEFSRFGSIDAMRSFEKHNEIIAAFKAKERDLASTLVEENWLGLGKMLAEGQEVK